MAAGRTASVRQAQAPPPQVSVCVVDTPAVGCQATPRRPPRLCQSRALLPPLPHRVRVHDDDAVAQVPSILHARVAEPV